MTVPDIRVQRCSIDALAELWCLFSSTSNSLERVQRQFDSALSCGIHEVGYMQLTCRLLKSLGEGATNVRLCLELWHHAVR